MIRAMENTSKNPFDFKTVKQNIKMYLLGEGYEENVHYIIQKVPNVVNITYGRDVGYKIEQESFDKETESISATEIRRPSESHSKSLVKAFSWRIIATVTTGLIGYALTGSVEVGAIMTFDFFLKLLLYYIHEDYEQCPIKEMEITFQCVQDTEKVYLNQSQQKGKTRMV